MKRAWLLLSLLPAGFLLALSVIYRPALAMVEPTPRSMFSASPSPVVTATALAMETPTSMVTAIPSPREFQQCYGCTPLTVKVRLSHYNPNQYDLMRPQLNCWNYSEEHKWCLSPVWIGVPWESGWNLFGACSDMWAVGSWVDVPGVGSWLCVDHGYEVDCDDDGICQVDVLGQGGPWDGKTYDATLWVPKSFLIRYAESQKEK